MKPLLWKYPSLSTICCFLTLNSLIRAAPLKKSYKSPTPISTSSPSRRPSIVQITGYPTNKPSQSNRPTKIATKSKPTSKPQSTFRPTVLPTKSKPISKPQSTFRPTVLPSLSPVQAYSTSKPLQTNGPSGTPVNSSPTYKPQATFSPTVQLSSSKAPSPSPTIPFAVLLPTSLPTSDKYSSPTKNSSPSVATLIPSSIGSEVAPTLRPSPTNNATLESCKSTSSGDYGLSTAQSVYVSYNYQIQIPQTANAGQVLSKLERKVTDLILPSLFSGKCASGGRRMPVSSEIIVVGVSALPDDIATASNDCVYVPAGARCYNVKGRLTLFLLDAVSGNSSLPSPIGRKLLDYNTILIAEVSAVVTSTIQSAMDSGTLLSMDNQIKALQYIDSNEDKVIAFQPSTVKSDPFPIYGYIIIVVMFVLMAILLVRRTRKHMQKSVKEDGKDDHVDGDIHSLRTYEDMNGDADIEALDYHDEFIHGTNTEGRKNLETTSDDPQILPSVTSEPTHSACVLKHIEDDAVENQLGLSEDIIVASTVLIDDHVSDRNNEPEIRTADDLDPETVIYDDKRNIGYAVILGGPTPAEDTIEESKEASMVQAPYDEKAVDHVNIFVEETAAQEKVTQEVEPDVLPPYDEKAFDGAIAFFRNDNADFPLLYTGKKFDGHPVRTENVQACDDIQSQGDEIKNQNDQHCLLGLVDPSHVAGDAYIYDYIGEESIRSGSNEQHLRTVSDE